MCIHSLATKYFYFSLEHWQDGTPHCFEVRFREGFSNSVVFNIYCASTFDEVLMKTSETLRLNQGMFCKYCFSLVHHTTTKSHQSCPTLCDPIDGSPPSSPFPGILQARILEWVAISFSMHESEK